MRSIVVLGSAFILAVLTPACGADECDGDALRELLARARPGETVEIGSCGVTGPFVVPAGVTLRGQGGADTTIDLSGLGVAVTLTPGGTVPTALRDVRIRSSACAGVTARGAGIVTLAGVAVDAARGIGVGIEGLTTLVIDRLSVRGPITADRRDDPPALPPFSCGSTPVATHGVVLVDVGQATLTAIDVREFAAFGALAVRSNVAWTGGTVADNMGVGVEGWGGDLTLTDVAISGSRQGTGPIEAYNALFAGGAVVTTERLAARDGDGFGVFHGGARARHAGLVSSGHGFAGVWSQASDALEVVGDARIEGNGFAGIATLDTMGVVIERGEVRSTREGLVLVGQTGTIRAADGIHVRESDVRLSDLLLEDNARVGFVLDLGGASSTRASITNVTVRGSGAALGAIAQNGDVVAGWDRGIVREGATMANDVAFADVLEIAGLVGPPCIPAPNELLAEGLSGLVEQ